MPIYEYKCSCGLKFEARKAIEFRASAQCPECGKQAGKVLSVVNNTFGFRFSDDSNERFHKDELVRNI